MRPEVLRQALGVAVEYLNAGVLEASPVGVQILGSGTSDAIELEAADLTVNHGLDEKQPFDNPHVEPPSFRWPPNGKVLEFYVDGCLGIRLDFVALRPWGDHEAGYYCAVFNENLIRHAVKGDDGGCLHLDDGVALDDVSAHDPQLSMAIESREVVEPVDGSDLRILPSLIRLYLFDPAPVALAKWRDVERVSAPGRSWLNINRTGVLADD